MIDVFLRWYPTTLIRRRMAMLVHARLTQMKGIHLSVFSKSSIPGEFHIDSKRLAEKSAMSEIYCIIDDDQLPLREDFFSYGASVLASHPDYGMLAGFPLEYGLYGQPYAGMDHAMIIDAHSIGCPYFVRKGTLKTFPDAPIHTYDGELSKVVTDRGLKTGLVRGCLYNHLGYGFSQVGELIK
jgi:hypothetical protein